MYGVIRHYHFSPENGPEIDQMVREDFVPLIKQAPGFIRYYWLDSGKGEGISLSLFNDKAGADESVRLAADWVRVRLRRLVTRQPDVIEGMIKAHD